MKNYKIFMLDPEDHATSHSAEAERIKGWNTGDISVHYISLMPEDVAAGWTCSFLKETVSNRTIKKKESSDG